ncbi:MAG: hypothetical protein HY318_15770 [Armatimonadetes bacterium]|nr:hypothetical protein [Armatimonadota bacterium]
MNIRAPNTNVTKSTVYGEAGEARYQEAEYLKDVHPSGAIYLAGYLVECYLKWALCERNQIQYLQELSDSDLADRLTSSAGHDLEALCAVTTYSQHVLKAPRVQRAFRIAAKWSPNLRYVKSCGGVREAVQFLAAVRTLRDDIRTWAHVS